MEMKIQKTTSSIIRRLKGSSVSIRKDIPRLKHLKYADELPHDSEDFVKFRDIFYRHYEKKVLNPFAIGKIQKNLWKRSIGSIAAIERQGKLFFSDCDHSRRIRTGSTLEESVNEFALKKGVKIIDDGYIRSKLFELFKGNVKIDGLFEYLQVSFGFEYKANLELDADKAPDVLVRVKNIQSLLNDLPLGGQAGLICLTTAVRNNLSKSILSKYGDYGEYVYGYQEFFNIFNVNFSEKEWKNLLLEARKKAQEEFDYYQNEYSSLGGQKIQ